jgi:hypothetical protein
VKPFPPIYEAKQVAQTILDVAESPKREAVVGVVPHGLLLMHALMPASTERRMAQKVQQEHFQDRRAEPGPGNLFEPLPQYASISGGWKEPSAMPTTLSAMAAVGLAVLGLGWALWEWSTSQSKAGRIFARKTPSRTERVLEMMGLRS